jgi:hypothetical protein
MRSAGPVRPSSAGPLSTTFVRSDRQRVLAHFSLSAQLQAPNRNRRLFDDARTRQPRPASRRPVLCDRPIANLRQHLAFFLSFFSRRKRTTCLLKRLAYSIFQFLKRNGQRARLPDLSTFIPTSILNGSNSIKTSLPMRIVDQAIWYRWKAEYCRNGIYGSYNPTVGLRRRGCQFNDAANQQTKVCTQPRNPRLRYISTSRRLVRP